MSKETTEDDLFARARELGRRHDHPGLAGAILRLVQHAYDAGRADMIAEMVEQSKGKTDDKSKG